MFALGSYQSVRLNRILSSHKCYYWSVIRLDREPLNRWLNTSGTCNSQGSNCKVEFDYIQIDPGAGARNETSESASADGSVFPESSFLPNVTLPESASIRPIVPSWCLIEM